MLQYGARVTFCCPRPCQTQREQHTITQKHCSTRQVNDAPCAGHEERATDQGTASALIDIPRIMPINSLKSIAPSPFLSTSLSRSAVALMSITLSILPLFKTILSSFGVILPSLFISKTRKAVQQTSSWMYCLFSMVAARNSV